MAVTYISPVATRIFGVAYAKGATVDVSSWSDRAIQRALDKGWITPSSGASLTIQDENANVSTAVTQIDFQGAGVTASNGTGEVVVTIPGGASASYPNSGPTATVVPRPMLIDVRDYGAVFNNSTDDTAAIQAAIDASPYPVSGRTGNDVPATIVQLAPGYSKISGSLSLPPNVWLRGHGPSATQLWTTSTTASIITLKTGTEAQTTVSDFLIGCNGTATAGAGIDYSNTAGGASILGDARHVIRDMVVVSTYKGVLLGAFTEGRLDRITVQRPVNIGIDVNSATDGFFSNCTVGQPGSHGIVVNGANHRIWGCKVFGGGSAGATRGFDLSGSGRSSITGCEVQDHNGVGFLIGSSAWVLTTCIADSTAAHGFSCDAQAYPNGPVMKACMTIKRGGGAYTPPDGMRLNNVAGGQIDLIVNGISRCLSLNGANAQSSSYFNVNNERGSQTASYATTITPDPFQGGIVIVGTVTGALTLANPTHATVTDGTVFHPAQRLVFQIPVDATGGYTLAFGTKYKLVGGTAPALAANTTVRIEFEFDGTNWRETGRAIT